MQTLKKNDYQIFEQLVKLKQPELMITLKAYLQKYYTNITMTKDYLIAVGEIPVAVVAHLDTVFAHPPTDIYYDAHKGVIWSPQGLGADDRAGVFLILKLLIAGFRPHIIFTTDEEKGSLGAAQLTKDMPKPFAEMKYIIQLDRHGTNDCVFYDCDNPEFTQYIESFGFIENMGSFSDISTLCPDWEVAGVNLSVGYNDEHSVIETLHINPLLSTYTKLVQMLNAINDAPSFKYIEAVYAYDSKIWQWYSQKNAAYGDGIMHIPYADDDTDTVVTCAHCGKIMYDIEAIPVHIDEKTTVFYCSDCVVDNVDWCSQCYTAYQKSDITSKTQPFICKSCKEGKTNTWITKSLNKISKK